MWKHVPGFVFVEASSSGQVRTVDHETTYTTRHGVIRTLKAKGRVLKPVLYENGRWYVNLPAPPGYKSRQKPVGVSRLVCLAFHGEPPEGKPWALHKDDVPGNNVPWNLYWGSPGENCKDKDRNGNTPRKEKHHSTILTEAQVADIKARYKPKTKKNGSFALAKEYGVHRTTIENIVSGRTWK